LLKRGFIELSGDDAVNFMVGNSVVIKKTDMPKGISAIDFDSRYYLSGYYYSPDGRIITFNCHHWPDFWAMGVTHWKLASGRLCIEDLSGNGEFGCGVRFERVNLTPSDRPDEWLVVTDEFPLRKIVGYSGNVFNFK
jgi:hypothetical protein